MEGAQCDETLTTSEIEPSKEYMQVLLEMGIDEEIAKKALLKTKNSSIEMAASYAFEMMDDETMFFEDAIDEQFKMVFVVNTGVNMSPGKLAAQVAHGALGLYRKLHKQLELRMNLNVWEELGEKKIVLKGKDEKHLLQLENMAQMNSIPCVSIRDAGLTEIPPDTLTVLALFGAEKEVDKVTKVLRLL